MPRDNINANATELSEADLSEVRGGNFFADIARIVSQASSVAPSPATGYRPPPRPAGSHPANPLTVHAQPLK